METLYSALKQTAEKQLQKTCINFYGKKITYKTFLNFIDAFCENLKKHDIKAGDTVTVCLPNSPSCAVVVYGLNKAGVKINLTHPYTPPLQLQNSIDETKSKAVIVYDIYLKKNGQTNFSVPTFLSDTGYFFSAIKKAVFHFKFNVKKISKNCILLESLFFGKAEPNDYYKFADNETAVLLPSGGTTGTPKIIQHNNSGMNYIAGHFEFFFDVPNTRYDAMYCVLPAFHGFGLCMNMHLSLLNGVTNVMRLKFSEKDLLSAIKKQKINIIIGVPSMYSRLLRSKKFQNADLSSLRECFVGGDISSQEIFEKFNNLLKSKNCKGRLFEGYGLTEAISVCTVNNLVENKQGSIGKALPAFEVKATKNGKFLPTGEVGEIAVSGPTLMLGYLDGNDNPIKEIDGKKWLFTGDCGSVDSDGFVFFKQRLKNIVKVNGVIVFPSEIERVVDAVSGVAKSCAVGVDDEIRGQAIKLFVEAEEGVDKEKLICDIKAEVKQKLIVYAMPREIEFISEIPLSAVGKVDRKQLS